MEERKTKATEKTEAEKIIDSLTGHFESDKNKLIDGIHHLRKIDASTKQCLRLGVQLYRLLLDNGLNESDVINPQRLYEKIDGFLYNNQVDMALSIVEVLDAVQTFQKKDENGNRVYCFNNEIEEQIFEESGLLTKQIVWLPSTRPMLLLTKAQILADNNKKVEALEVVEQVLELNPVYFEALLFKAQLLKEKQPKKHKEMLQNCWKFAYTAKQMVDYYTALYAYYYEKEDFVKAYATISAVKIFDDAPQVFDEINALREKMTHTVVTPFKVPTAEQILKILERENIDVQIPDANYKVLIYLYEKHYLAQDDVEFQKELASIIQELAGQEDIIKIINKRLKNK